MPTTIYIYIKVYKVFNNNNRDTGIVRTTGAVAPCSPAPPPILRMGEFPFINKIWHGASNPHPNRPVHYATTPMTPQPMETIATTLINYDIRLQSTRSIFERKSKSWLGQRARQYIVWMASKANSGSWRPARMWKILCYWLPP